MNNNLNVLLRMETFNNIQAITVHYIYFRYIEFVGAIEFE